MASELDTLIDEFFGSDEDMQKRARLLWQFLENCPEYRPEYAKTQFGEGAYMRTLLSKFSQGRKYKKPSLPSTKQDKAIAIILATYFDVPIANISDAEIAHKQSMAAENIIGDILERFIASILEPKGWIWCSGSVAKSTDFIHLSDSEEWILLQIKNRDNSENSASSKVRKGTIIKKWFRTFSKKEDTNWQKFPIEPKCEDLSEEKFEAFMKQYLETLK